MREPVKEELVPGPPMWGYIYQEVLGVPEKNNFQKNFYQIVEGEPVWLDENDKVVTCPRFSELLVCALDALHEISLLTGHCMRQY